MFEYELNLETWPYSDLDSGSESSSYASHHLMSQSRSRSNLKEMPSCNYFSAANTSTNKRIDREKNEQNLLKKYQSFNFNTQ